ncbi:MAG: SIS domain-containing protein [Actinomycetota bacterium]
MTPTQPGAKAAADIAEQPQVVARALERNATRLEQARALVQRSSLVRLLAIGSSRHAAGYGGQALEILGDIPATVMPAPGAAVPLPRLHADQIVIVLSQSGRTPALLDAAKAAREAGVQVIAVTNEPDSPLEAIATVTLSCEAGPERVIAATKSVTSQAVLLRALACPIDKPNVEALIEAMRRAVEEVDSTKAVRGEIPRTVVCSGFAGEWIADEIALKFAEMTGRLVAAEPLVEHLHGPVAAPAFTLAFLDPADPNTEALSGHRRLVRVGPHASYDLLTPTTGDASLDSLVWLVIGQRIVMAWAHLLGEDPDAQRGLSKITLTL